MAIDTAEKRNSVMQTPGEMPWTPDGALSATDRLPMLEFYTGITPSDGQPNYMRGVFFGRSVLGGSFNGRSVFGGTFRGN